MKSLEATKSIFLVTNGQDPDMIQKLEDEDALPTQLYLSTYVADYQSFMKINRPRYDDSRERWNRTLKMLSTLSTRTVLRITLIRDYNDNEEMIPAFASLLLQSNAHFVEIKSYMHIGRSTNRLEHSDMLEMDEIRSVANNLAQENSDFTVMDESEISRIVILQNKKRFVDRFIPAYC